MCDISHHSIYDNQQQEQQQQQLARSSCCNLQIFCIFDELNSIFQERLLDIDRQGHGDAGVRILYKSFPHLPVGQHIPIYRS